MNKTIHEMRKAGAQHVFTEIAAWLTAVGKGATAGEVAKEFNLSRSTARRYLLNMCADGWLEMWTVPDKRSVTKTLYACPAQANGLPAVDAYNEECHEIAELWEAMDDSNERWETYELGLVVGQSEDIDEIPF